MSRCSKLRLPHKLDLLCIDFNFSVETFDFVAFHHTKRTNICTCITLSTLYGLQTLDPVEVHRSKTTLYLEHQLKPRIPLDILVYHVDT